MMCYYLNVHFQGQRVRSEVFWDVTLCRYTSNYRRLEELFCLHFQVTAFQAFQVAFYLKVYGTSGAQTHFCEVMRYLSDRELI